MATARTVTATGRDAPAMPKFISKPQTYFKYGPLDHACAGLTAGFITTMTLHPLDLIKTRFQGVRLIV